MRVGIEDMALMAGVKRPDAVDLLRRAAGLGAQGVHFSTVVTFPGRDAASVRNIARTAESMDLYVEVGMGACNPASNILAPGDAGRDVREVLREMIAVAASAGSGVLRTFVGWLEERRLASPTWSEQLDHVADVLTEVAPAARDAGVVICIENHMDITASELLSLVERVDSPAVGVCFDTANPLMLCEDPLEACRMLASHVRCTHIKDAVLAGTVDAPRYVSSPLGKGVVDLEEIVRALAAMSPCTTLSVEDHGGVLELHAPSEGDAAVRDLRRANQDKLAAWISRGNEAIEHGEFPMLFEMYDDEAREAVADRCGRNLAMLKGLVEK